MSSGPDKGPNLNRPCHHEWPCTGFLELLLLTIACYYYLHSDITLLYFYCTLHLPLPLALQLLLQQPLLFLPLLTPVMLHCSIRVVFRILVNQVLVKTEVLVNQDTQIKGTVVCAVGASRPLIAKEVLYY